MRKGYGPQAHLVALGELSGEVGEWARHRRDGYWCGQEGGGGAARY